MIDYKAIAEWALSGTTGTSAESIATEGMKLPSAFIQARAIRCAYDHRVIDEAEYIAWMKHILKPTWLERIFGI